MVKRLARQRQYTRGRLSSQHLRMLQRPLMPGSSTEACSTRPIPLRTIRNEPSAPAPLHVTTWQAHQVPV